MHNTAHSQQARRQAGPLLFPALAAAAILLLRPACPIHSLTGLQCPDCGATRALLALLHAKPVVAFHHNPLFTLLLPLLLAYAALYAVQALRHRSALAIPTPILTTLLLLTATFTLYRNL